MAENEEKRLQRLTKIISEMKAQQQAIIARNKERQRKEKTRRLIQNGALAEKYLHCKNMSRMSLKRRCRGLQTKQIYCHKTH